MVDAFTAAQRADRFRAALGSYGRALDRNTELDDLLNAAESNLWDVERLGLYLAGRLPAGAGSGLVVLHLRTLAVSPEPASPNEHAARAVAAARGPFRQPRPPCGQCDGTPARWIDVTPAGHAGQNIVDHCSCWTAPPGYLPARSRRGAAAR